jgi:ketosteroid isomerase-like protein
MIEATSGIDLVAPLQADPSDHPAVRALRQIADPAFETCMFDLAGTATCRHGLEGYVELWQQWMEAFDRFSYEQSDEPVADGDVVVNFVRQRGRIRGSDAEVTSDGAAVWFFRDGRLIRLEFHIDREAALRSAGIAD